MPTFSVFSRSFTSDCKDMLVRSTAIASCESFVCTFFAWVTVSGSFISTKMWHSRSRAHRSYRNLPDDLPYSKSDCSSARRTENRFRRKKLAPTSFQFFLEIFTWIQTFTPGTRTLPGGRDAQDGIVLSGNQFVSGHLEDIPQVWTRTRGNNTY